MKNANGNRYDVQKIHSVLEEIASGKPISHTAQGNGISEQTANRWNQAFCGMNLQQIARVRKLEKEQGGLRQQVARLRKGAKLQRAMLRKKW